MPNVNLDDDFLKQFYGITDASVPANVDVFSLKNQLFKITDLIKDLKANAKPVKKELPAAEEENNGPAILVVDDLGVITYQLKVLLSRYDFDVDCSQEIYDAVNKYKKRKYAYVVMDLFIPTEREGFILLTELKKLAQSYDVQSVVGVITASPRKEIEQQCRARGADFFLEKNNEWQANLVEVMNGYIKPDNEDEDF